MKKFNFSREDNPASLHPNIIGFVPRYISNRKDDYENLKAFVQDKDFEAIRDYCHKVVGTARSYHFYRLEEITKQLQTHSRNEDIESILELMPAYDHYIQSVFNQYLPSADGEKK